MAIRKTQEVFLNEMVILHPTILVSGKYLNNATKIECICQVCNTTFYQSPNSLLSKHGCPVCNNTKLTLDIFKERLYKINRNIEVMGNYVNARTKIKCMCLIDGFEWSATPDSLLKGHGCKRCMGRKISEKQLKSHEQFVEEYSKIHSDIDVVSKYKGAKNQIILKCRICKEEWLSTPTNSLKENYGCPNCNRSYGEKKIKEFLDKNNLIYEQQKSYENLLGVGGRKLSYDFYLPKNNLLVEYQGEFHDGTAWQQDEDSFKRQKEHDLRKRNYASKNKIELLEIWYYDFNYIDNFLFDAVFGGELDDSDQ